MACANTTHATTGWGRYGAITAGGTDPKIRPPTVAAARKRPPPAAAAGESRSATVRPSAPGQG